MKVAFFDTKPYDVPGFDCYAVDSGLEIKYFEPKLNIEIHKDVLIFASYQLS